MNGDLPLRSRDNLADGGPMRRGTTSGTLVQWLVLQGASFVLEIDAKEHSSGIEEVALRNATGTCGCCCTVEDRCGARAYLVWVAAKAYSAGGCMPGILLCHSKNLRS